MIISRRVFIGGGLAAGGGFLGLKLMASGASAQLYRQEVSPYGELQSDAAAILDLPPGFSYLVLSRMGEAMSDGLKVPGDPDGMAAFAGDRGRIILVRNHELDGAEPEKGAFGAKQELLPKADRARLYDQGTQGPVFIGGTTTLVYDPASGKVEKQFLSLGGTLRNCAGGPTPWGSWLSCEETEDKAGENGAAQDHGYVFEVKADAKGGLIQAEPLKAMGRFYHEAAGVDPRTGIVYMTEDRDNGLFYRFVPEERGVLAKGGKLQALALSDKARADTRNWQLPNAPVLAPGERLAAHWIDIEDVEGREAHVREGGHAKGAALFARGEGIWFGQGHVYMAMTNGGRIGAGQIWRYRPSPFEGTRLEFIRPGHIELFIEPNDRSLMDMCDNITLAPWGDLIICEDGPGENFLRGLTSEGKLYTLARNAIPSANGTTSEFCGACFSPDGATLFVNIQKPGLTLAITGPWHSRVS